MQPRRISDSAYEVSPLTPSCGAILPLSAQRSEVSAIHIGYVSDEASLRMVSERALAYRLHAVARNLPLTRRRRRWCY